VTSILKFSFGSTATSYANVDHRLASKFSSGKSLEEKVSQARREVFLHRGRTVKVTHLNTTMLDLAPLSIRDLKIQLLILQWHITCLASATDTEFLLFRIFENRGRAFMSAQVSEMKLPIEGEKVEPLRFTHFEEAGGPCGRRAAIGDLLSRSSRRAHHSTGNRD